MGLERLDKLLASQGVASRSDAGQMIRAGRVRVDGRVCRSPAEKADGALQEIRLDGAPLSYSRHVYIMLNKPPGLLCVSRDPQAATVMDLLPPALRRPGLFPAGRLDKDTVGLVLITDDGDFAPRLLSPRRHVEKRYLARLDGPVTREHIERFAAGTSLEDGTRCLPAFLRVAEDGAEPLAEISIQEGKYHQIKRMFLSVNRKVLWLKRISMGGLELDPTLPEGACRLLSAAEKEAVLG